MMRRKASIALTHRGDLRGLPWGGLGEGIMPSGIPYLVYDTFTDTNGVILPNHVPEIDVVGGGWISRPTDWTINGNTADPPAGGGRRYTTIDVGVTDVRMGLRVKMGVNEGVGFIGRLQDNTHCWFYILLEATNLAAIYLDDAAFNQVASSPYAVAPNTWYDMEARVHGNVHEIWLDGALAVTWTGAQFNAETEFGLWVNSPGAVIRMDDLWIMPY